MKKLKGIAAACAPTALCYASGVDEETVLRVCAMHGFEAGEGMADIEYLEAAADLKMMLTRVRITPIKLRKFIRKYPMGLYLVATWDHLFCVDNGIIADPRNGKPGLDRIIRQAWRVF